MEIDRIRIKVHVITGLVLVLNSNFRGLWWSQFELWRLTSNILEARADKNSNFRS
jgi:hypothetical protein